MQSPLRNDVKPFREPVPEGGYVVNWSDPQQSFAESEAPVTVMQAGRQAGKTASEVEILALEMERCGPGDYLFVAPTYPLMEARIKPELRDCFVRYRGFIERPGYHRFESLDRGEDGQPLYRILLGSAVNPESLASSTVKAAIIDELAQNSFPWAAWQEVQRAVAVNQGRIYAGTTLYDVSGAYKLEIYDRWLNGDPRINIIMADSISNPAFSVEQYEYFRETMPGWKFDMMYRGRYSRPVGLVYDCFDESTQVISRIPAEQMSSWPRYWGHDFGPSNTAALCLAQDPSTGLMYVERTYHRGEMSVGQHADEFKSLSANTIIRMRAGGNWAEEEARYAYTASGWPIIKPGIRDVEAGIDQVYSWMARGQLFVFNDLTEFLNELLTYSREVTDTFQVTDKIRDKSRYHLMDCFIKGTMVQTDHGPKSIETLSMSDKIATREGFQPIVSHGMTKKKVPVMTVKFSNGTSLTGTPEHPVWVKDKGFVAIDSLRYGDKIEPWKEKLLYSKASPTIFTLNPSVDQIGSIFLARAKGYIEPFGRMLTEKSLQVWLSTIRIMIPWITGWKILSCSPLATTCGITTNTANMTSTILLESNRLPRNGISLSRGVSGTANIAKRYLASVPGLKRLANSVERGIRLLSQHAVNFVTKTARQRREQDVYVISVRPCRTKANVYNLHVANCPEYYANGVLVHNCLRYIMSTLPVERALGQRKAMLKTYNGRRKKDSPLAALLGGIRG